MPLSRISTLLLLAVATTAGCAAGSDEAATDAPIASAPSADDGAGAGDPNGSSGNVEVDVTVNEIGSNDQTGKHHHWGHWGHDHCSGQVCTCPPTTQGQAAPPPPPRPANSSPPDPR